MSAPSSSPQDQFFMAARTGSVSEMQEACMKGADPHAMTEEGLSSWQQVTTYAPFPSMKACFAFLKSHAVPLFCPSHTPDVHHPGLQIFAYHPALQMFDNLRGGPALEIARTFWRLWSYMTPEEQHRLLKEQDFHTNINETWNIDADSHSDKAGIIWSTRNPTCLPFTSTTYRVCEQSIPPLASPASSPFLTQEAFLVFVRSLHLICGTQEEAAGFDEGMWGALCATAPLSTLKACLKNQTIRSLMHKGITSSLLALRRDDWEAGLAVQQVCLRIIRRCHNAGLRWPDQWPEETREALLTFPEIHAWLDRRALKKSLDAPSLVPVLRRARV